MATSRTQRRQCGIGRHIEILELVHHLSPRTPIHQPNWQELPGPVAQKALALEPRRQHKHITEIHSIQRPQRFQSLPGSAFHDRLQEVHSFHCPSQQRVE